MYLRIIYGKLKNEISKSVELESRMTMVPAHAWMYVMEPSPTFLRRQREIRSAEQL